MWVIPHLYIHILCVDMKSLKDDVILKNIMAQVKILKIKHGRKLGSSYIRKKENSSKLFKLQLPIEFEVVC